MADMAFEVLGFLMEGENLVIIEFSVAIPVGWFSN